MSLYAMIFGDAALIRAQYWFVALCSGTKAGPVPPPSDIEAFRFRDGWVEETSDPSDPYRIVLYTRTGGNNREGHVQANRFLESIPGFVETQDDSYDPTFALWRYKPSAKFSSLLDSFKAMKPSQLEALWVTLWSDTPLSFDDYRFMVLPQPKVDPGKRWQEAIAKIGPGDANDLA